MAHDENDSYRKIAMGVAAYHALDHAEKKLNKEYRKQEKKARKEAREAELREMMEETTQERLEKMQAEKDAELERMEAMTPSEKQAYLAQKEMAKVEGVTDTAVSIGGILLLAAVPLWPITIPIFFWQYAEHRFEVEHDEAMYRQRKTTAWIVTIISVVLLCLLVFYAGQTSR